MNRKWLKVAAVCVLLVVGFYKGGGSPEKAMLWLGLQGSAEHDQAKALRPLINCLNDGDLTWRRTWLSLRLHDDASDPSARLSRFIDSRLRRNGALSQMDTDIVRHAMCQPNIPLQQALGTVLPDFLPPLHTYGEQLRLAREITDGSEYFWNGTPENLSASEVAALDQRVQPPIQDFMQASDALRNKAETLDLQLRLAQRERIKARYREDQHWQVLGFMIQARQTVNTLTAFSANGSLTPSQLNYQTRLLNSAFADSSRYMNTHFDSNSADAVYLLWRLVEPLGKEYIRALEKLHGDWLAKVEPQRLSNEFLKATQTYDQLLYAYNLRVRERY